MRYCGMPKRSRTKLKAVKASPRKRPERKEPPRDENQMAYDLVRQIEEMGAEAGGKNPLAVALGRLGGLKGGRARADKMTKEQRKESALKAARARWGQKGLDKKV